MNEEPVAPYERLLALGMCELELVRAGRLRELILCQHARAELMKTLPAVAPAGVRETLERCLLIERQLASELADAREAVLVAMAELRRAQRAAEGYMPQRPRLRVVSADA